MLLAHAACVVDAAIELGVVNVGGTVLVTVEALAVVIVSVIVRVKVVMGAVTKIVESDSRCTCENLDGCWTG